MIAIDTNILLRLTLDDSKEQSARARGLIEAAALKGETVYISPIAIAEYVWTLQRGYRLSRSEQVAAVLIYFNRPPFRLFSEGAIEHAIQLFESGTADFSDCLMAAMNSAASVTSTYSFDKAAIADNIFTAI